MTKVTAAIIIKDGKVLIAKRKSTQRLAGLWEFPGGKIEPGETPEQCLKRELQEEFEIDSLIGQCIGTSIYQYPFGTIELSAYKVTLFHDDFKLNDHSEIAWVSDTQISDYKFTPADIPFVDMIEGHEIDF